MKCLGFQVQVVVRYHGHHITNIRCRPNTRIHIGFLLELFLFQLVLYHVDVTRVDGEISMEFILDSYLPDFLQIHQCNGGSSNVAAAELSVGNVFCGFDPVDRVLTQQLTQTLNCQRLYSYVGSPWHV